MRRLASFDNPEFARTLSEVLYAANIDSDVRSGPDRTLSVWVVTEQDMPRAQAILRAFEAEPLAAEYADARALAEQRARPVSATSAGPSGPAQPERRPERKRLVQRARESPVSFGLLLICLVVGLLTQLGNRTDFVSYLTIASFERSDGMLRWYGYRDLLQGELWRLFTPIFIHFGPFHLLFNAFWMNDLGNPTERFQGSLRYALFVAFCAAVSNIAQLWFGHTPSFGGLSGVIYALVGYLWARGTADPRSGIRLPGQLVAFFLGWMALGFSGILDSVVGGMANYCHLGGFVAGAAYGYVGALVARRRAR